MLKLKHSFHLPHFEHNGGKPLQLEAIPVDDDELTRAIYDDPINQDDNWTLDERPETNELNSFWTVVTNDLKKDPSWNNFTREDS